ncbi:uncharacterized protein C1orf189 homolog [Pseudonaja textilis]|uniref:uncharacterized protein C1orf189 homolog n=1 Tax=Pseudonaja textilis TaxID=8673 RepID=UPI000EA977BF|nr:uncharacterized protein C1orf189 homolog [Pseudonaja textilis]
MASSEHKKPLTHAALREKLLKEEEFQWKRERDMCLELKSQEDRCFARSRKRHQTEMKEEMHYANKQLMMLRRAALKHLLSIEHLQYQLEFNHLGMSFYAERL